VSNVTNHVTAVLGKLMEDQLIVISSHILPSTERRCLN